ncbi:alkaline phosphatase D family protein [Thermoactinospora rubra]|uniref:alkaline phosphatase D family protein n=1 Tax=Thermoactinospora rubra TaxID=1088767 RepID=UPI001981D977|nr:alkaline phosphatase D family protein [Thermoactinospora rubra]
MANPFTLGVASGEPFPDSLIIWTRLAPSPLHLDPARPGGLPDRPVEVRWQVAEDERFARIVRAGATQAQHRWAFSVHVRVDGLRPGTDYFYRFRSGGHLSPAGRTRTAPDPRSTAPVRFALANCQRFEHGHYTAHRHLAAERPDIVFFVGDYVYESRQAADPVRTLPLTGEADTLHEYRLRYARYKLDRDLQAAHAAAPWVPTWDDHEVADNYTGASSFFARRARAYRAYYEHLPLRVRPEGHSLQMFRRRTYGTIADFLVLDSRQYRVPGVSMLGQAQEDWLLARLRASPVRWKVLVQPLFFARRLIPGSGLRPDAWDGFPEQRRRVLDVRAPGLVVLSGDVHNTWACDLKADFLDPGSPIVGSEFVTTAVSSRPPATDADAVLRANPHIRFFDGRRGYASGTASATEFRLAFRAVDFVDRPGAPVRTVAEFVTEGQGMRRSDV